MLEFEEVVKGCLGTESDDNSIKLSPTSTLFPRITQAAMQPIKSVNVRVNAN
jgi:hypothetical protein